MDITGIAQDVLLDRYAISVVSDEVYWDFYQQNFRTEDVPTAFIDIDKLYQDRYAEVNQDSLCLHIKEGNEVVAICRGYAKSSQNFEMEHTVVAKSHRRVGLYSAIVGLIIEHTRKQQFAEIGSIHSPSNNPILIAKMKKGFCITAMELDPRFGVNVRLSYFHDDDARAAYRLRCGDISMTQTMLDYSHGSLAELKTVIEKP